MQLKFTQYGRGIMDNKRKRSFIVELIIFAIMILIGIGFFIRVKLENKRNLDKIVQIEKIIEEDPSALRMLSEKFSPKSNEYIIEFSEDKGRKLYNLRITAIETNEEFYAKEGEYFIDNSIMTVRLNEGFSVKRSQNNEETRTFFPVYFIQIPLKGDIYIYDVDGYKDKLRRMKEVFK